MTQRSDADSDANAELLHQLLLLFDLPDIFASALLFASAQCFDARADLIFASARPGADRASPASLVERNVQPLRAN